MPKKGYQDIKKEVLIKRTGKDFSQWKKILDKFDVKKNGRKTSAEFLRNVYKVNAWWSQVIVVMYEYEKKIKR